jgi:hypothetical protein
MVVSGELSMTRVFPVVEALLELDAELELELELEHAPSPAASKQAVAAAKSHLILCNLLISLVFLSGVSSVVDYVVEASPPSGGLETSSGAATSRCQQAAPRVSEICIRAGSSRRHWSSANGHLGLNGQPCVAAPSRFCDLPAAVAAPWRRPPPRSALPRLSGSGAEATSSCV